MKVYHKISNFLYQVLRWITVVTVVAMLVLMLVEVVRRYLFDKTFLWSDEIIRYLLLTARSSAAPAPIIRRGSSPLP